MPRELIGSFARHLMVHVDRWQESGFKPIGADYLARLAPEKGTRRGIDGNGDLLVHRTGKTRPPAERRRAGCRRSSTAAGSIRETGEPLL